MWKFFVKNQSIEILEREVLADHQIQYVQMKFTFDGDWKRFHKVVQFAQCDEVYSIVLGVDEASCYLPAELHFGAVKMSLFGYDANSNTTVRATTVPVTLNIRQSGFVGDDETPIPPTPDLYTQLLKRIEEAVVGQRGKSAYEIAVEHGFSGTETEWLASLHGADGADGKDGVDGRDGIDGKDGADGKDGVDGRDGANGKDGADGKDGVDGKDGITPDLSAYATTALLNEQILLLREALAPLEHVSHAHQNKDLLDSITEELLSDLEGYGAFSDLVKEQIHTLFESVNNYSNTAHTHENKDVLDGITAADVARWNGIETLKSDLTQVRNKSNSNADRLHADEATIDCIMLELSEIHEEIERLSGGGMVKLFYCGDGTLDRYGESIYTFYQDGYRSMSGFAQSYPNFCSGENGYALYYNQTDFNWGAIIYTMLLTPFHVTAQSSIIMSYLSGASEEGELYLVPKHDSLTGAELARYIHERVIGGQAIRLDFKWLQSSSYITTMTECTGVSAGEYYIAWKAVTDNTHPKIKAVKVMGG